MDAAITRDWQLIGGQTVPVTARVLAGRCVRQRRGVGDLNSIRDGAVRLGRQWPGRRHGGARAGGVP